MLRLAFISLFLFLTNVCFAQQPQVCGNLTQYLDLKTNNNTFTAAPRDCFFTYPNHLLRIYPNITSLDTNFIAGWIDFQYWTPAQSYYGVTLVDRTSANVGMTETQSNGDVYLTSCDYQILAILKPRTSSDAPSVLFTITDPNGAPIGLVSTVPSNDGSGSEIVTDRSNPPASIKGSTQDYMLSTYQNDGDGNWIYRRQICHSPMWTIYTASSEVLSAEVLALIHGYIEANVYLSPGAITGITVAGSLGFLTLVAVAAGICSWVHKIRTLAPLRLSRVTSDQNL